jgi:hypothetical protein
MSRFWVTHGMKMIIAYTNGLDGHSVVGLVGYSDPLIGTYRFSTVRGRLARLSVLFLCLRGTTYANSQGLAVTPRRPRSAPTHCFRRQVNRAVPRRRWAGFDMRGSRERWPKE